MGGLQITITPADALIDEPRRIMVTGTEPGEVIEVRAQTQRSGVTWQSQASFTASDRGFIDLGQTKPLAGSSYESPDSMGLIWSQTPVNSTSRELFNNPVTGVLVTKLSVHGAGAGQSVATEATFTQRLAAEGVTRHEVREDELAGESRR